jgi:esterase FrsA
MKHYSLTPSLSLSYVGPSLDKGPLPALFYFALSAEDSLTLAPFNTPITLLTPYLHEHLRIFSMTIPGHKPPLPKEKAIHFWAEHIQKGHDPISPFIEQICTAIDSLLHQNALIKDRILLAGLSRGSYIATLAAARHPLCPKVLGFAPLTDFSSVKEFEHLLDHPLVKSLNLSSHLPELLHTHIRYYIGNRDTRTGTTLAFNLITQLAELAHAKRIREGHFELILYSSIGFMGHGTPQSIFQEGCQWIKNSLLLP